ncbi:hypothetical protein AAY473_035790 [Plecturocebus cupreus]
MESLTDPPSGNIQKQVILKAPTNIKHIIKTNINESQKPRCDQRRPLEFYHCPNVMIFSSYLYAILVTPYYEDRLQRQSLTLFPRLECSGADLSSSQPPPPGFKWDFAMLAMAGLELLTSGDPPTLASQSAGITGISHCTQPMDPGPSLADLASSQFSPAHLTQSQVLLMIDPCESHPGGQMEVRAETWSQCHEELRPQPLT